ncbi:MAG: hypothetical protein GY801_43620, partial [bacterium]|nr:hypothetical protein [bacterium]
MKASIKTQLLAMCILLVLVTTLSISIAYYVLAKQDKHRESQQRLQIALEIILDDLNRQSQRYIQKIDDYLRRDDTFRTAVNIYLQDQNPLERNIGLRPFLVSQLADLKHIISVDRLALHFADGQLLADYPSSSTSGAEAPQALSEEHQTFDGMMTKETSARLFRKGQTLGFKVTAPFFHDEKMTGMLVAEVFMTQDMLEHYRALSKTETNFFAGKQFSLGTLSAQAALESEWLEQRISCHDLSEEQQRIDVVSVSLDGHDY